MRGIFAALLLGVSICASAQAPVVVQRAPITNTDIFLLPLTQRGDSIVVGRAVNVTHRDGYDNQPAFTPDSRFILYSARSDSQADIWRYDIAAGTTRRLTDTPESEYSPQVMPGGRRFSVVRVERDSTQRVWSFPITGGTPALVLRDLKPVGYHLWLSKDRIAAYVLGTPSTLHLVNADGTRDTVIATDVGRALQLLPGRTLFSYTQRDTTKRLRVMGAYRIAADPYPQPLTVQPADNEYHAWTPAGTLLTISKGVLQRWNGKTGRIGAWLPVADLAAQGIANASRLAVSPDGRWLAVVAETGTP